MAVLAGSSWTVLPFFFDWAELGWLGPLVVVVVFLIFLLLAVLSVSWARQYLHCHRVDGCGASLIFFWCLPSVFYFFLWTLLYESPGGNQVDGLPPARHTGVVVLGRQVGQRRSVIFDIFLLNLNDVLISVSRSVTFECFI